MSTSDYADHNMSAGNAACMRELNGGYRVSAHMPFRRSRGFALAASERPQAEVRAARKKSTIVYPFSVIPGGAYSAGELETSLNADQVAAMHYAVFQRPLVRAAPSPFTGPVYVSYRKGSSIYWTRRPLQLSIKETLLTDGTNFARARCGNRISTAPQQPVSLDEPEEAVLDTPELPPGSEPGQVILGQVPQLAPEIFPPGFPVTTDRLAASMSALLGGAAQPMNGFVLYGR